MDRRERAVNASRLLLIKRTLAIRQFRARLERLELTDRPPDVCADLSAWASRGRWRGGPEGGAGHRDLPRAEEAAPIPWLPPSPCRWDQARMGLGVSPRAMWVLSTRAAAKKIDLEELLVDLAASLGHA